MNLKKYLIISILGTFFLAFLTHFLYNMFPSNLLAIFFPVNESIWEHMKMLYTTILLYQLIETAIFKIKKIKINNFIFSSFISSIISIPIYLILFLPIYYKLGENMFITITIMFIVMTIIEIIKYKLFNVKNLKLEIISIFFITITYIIMGILTFNPPENDLFFDTVEEKYGINNYVI